jgi:nucleoside-diphosphate kinase
MAAVARDILAYQCTIYDARSQLVKELRLNSFVDGTIELLNKDRTKTIMKRIWCPDVPRSRLFPGSTVDVFGKALEVTGPADLGTRDWAEANTSSSACCCVLDDERQLPALISALEKRFTALQGIRTITNAPTELFGRLDTNSVAVVCDVYLVGEGSTAAAAALASCVSAAGARPTAVDVDAGALAELPNRACAALETDEPCSLMIVKPHIGVAKRLGEVLAAVVEAGYGVAGCQLVTLDAKICGEFFAPYTGVWNRQEAIAHHCVEGPALAVQVRAHPGDFRDFCGPCDVLLARTLRPKSIRALFGESVVKNAVHCTDLDDDGRLECNYFFNVLQGLC